MQDDRTTQELAQTAARLIAEDGLDFASAKRKAAAELGLSPRTPLPDHLAVEREVWSHRDLFLNDDEGAADVTAALRSAALAWMLRMAEFAPMCSGGVWLGWATRATDVWLQLYTDDSKAPEIALLDMHQAFEARETSARLGHQQGIAYTLSLHQHLSAIDQDIGVHLQILSTQDQRGALVPDAWGRRPRGDATALKERIANGFEDRPPH